MFKNGAIQEFNICYGKYYKAYQIKDRYILPYNDKKSIINRIAIFEKYAVRLEHKKYYDSIYGINEDFTLERFLGLPKELIIDYNKKIVSQLKFSKMLDEIIDPKESFEIEKTNLYNKKVKVNAYKEIKHQNACIERGFLYFTDIKNAFILVDKIKRKDIRKLLPSISQYEIPNCINKGYNPETKGPNRIPNPYREEQIKMLLRFFALPDKLLAEIYFGADKEDVDLERVYKKYNLDKRYIALEGTIHYDSNYVSKIKIFNTGVVNIYKNLYYNLYEPLKSYLTKKDDKNKQLIINKRENKNRKVLKRKANSRYFVYILKRIFFLKGKPSFIISRKDIKTLFYYFNYVDEILLDVNACLYALNSITDDLLDEGRFDYLKDVEVLDDIYVRIKKQNILSTIENLSNSKIFIKTEYKTRLKKVLTKDEYNNLLQLADDREKFFEYFNDLTVDYLESETQESTDDSFELEALFNLISDDN